MNIEERFKVYVFDFDGTLTDTDTLLLFIKYVFGRRKYILTMLLFSPLIVLMLMGVYPNWKLKQNLFAYLFKGMKLSDFDDLCHDFMVNNIGIMRPKGMETIRKAIEDGVKVMVVSASIENWVRPFFNEFGNKVIVTGTRIESKNGIITGNFLTKNCYGEEKVKRIQRVFPFRKTYHLTVFGDSDGDRKMMEYADASYFKPFGKSRERNWKEIVRFGVVGVIATIIQTTIYLVAVGYVNYAISNTLGYAVSLAFNYIASTKYTFNVQPTIGKGLGFLLSHAINFILQTSTLYVFIQLIGMSERVSLIPMFAICVPVNFILVRFFLKKGNNKG